MSKLDADTRERIKRMALFQPCKTKEHLHTWIKVYLNLDLPNVIVCDDDVTQPPSNSCPMDLVWEIYSKALDGNDEAFQKILAYACRGGYKTVACSILEVLALLHLGRNVAHAAAIESQAQVCGTYLAQYFQKPYLREFVVGKNKREITVVRYLGEDGAIINKATYDALSEIEKRKYVTKTNWMKIIVATMGGMNAIHVPLLILDELDLVKPKPLQESEAIPSKGENGELPITFLTSSRKFSFGEVQKALDKAHKTGLVVRHWNIIDVTERCKPDRHLPDEPKIDIYYNEDTLAATTKEEFDLLAPEEQQKWYKKEGFAGCLKNCSMFAVCRGRLATKQTSNSTLLLRISDVKGKVTGSNPDFVKAQLMCWKPSSEGLIYPHFSRAKHVLSAAEMAEKITGEPFPKNFNKAQLIDLMIHRNMTFHLGMDFGFTHNFACVLGGMDGNRMFIIDVLAAPGLEITQKIEICKSKYLGLDPMVYPDPAYPSDIKTFRRAGFRCKNFVKDVMEGINAVRSKFMPGFGKEPELFILNNDPGCEKLIGRLIEYHWVVDTETEIPTDVPEEKDDDECDALRYLCQNLFASRTRFNVSTADGSGPGDSQNNTKQNWLKNKVKELTGGENPNRIIGRKGNFFFDC